ncbi:lipocalin family protein [Flavobacterium sp. GP15]|uniref:lipocalin family protein n=1 Tax=Flavobacterium sp. GP15 TaxID=2758567 RepID=UPI00165E47A8|nr:lipocalin family protein [Flavobacterium sp. GP15]
MKTNKIIYLATLFLIVASICSCKTIPENVTAVKPFYKEKYLGKWYEIARLDFKFEKDLNNTTAEYSLKDDGEIKVVNKGYNVKKHKWTQAIGKAKFVGSEDIAMLKVSFFGPFYAGYNIIAIDENYKYALVAGKSTKYLWILSRETTIPDAIKKDYLRIAEKTGYTTKDLIWVKQDKQN